MTTGGTICLFLFMILTVISLFVYASYGSVYLFMQSIEIIVLAISFIAVLVFYRIGKRMGDQYG